MAKTLILLSLIATSSHATITIERSGYVSGESNPNYLMGVTCLSGYPNSWGAKTSAEQRQLANCTMAQSNLMTNVASDGKLTGALPASQPTQYYFYTDIGETMSCVDAPMGGMQRAKVSCKLTVFLENGESGTVDEVVDDIDWTPDSPQTTTNTTKYQSNQTTYWGWPHDCGRFLSDPNRFNYANCPAALSSAQNSVPMIPYGAFSQSSGDPGMVAFRYSGPYLYCDDSTASTYVYCYYNVEVNKTVPGP